LVIFLHDKSETQEVLKKFLKSAQNKIDAKVKKIRSDNRTECVLQANHSLCESVLSLSARGCSTAASSRSSLGSCLGHVQGCCTLV
jgi:hypothetical protein